MPRKQIKRKCGHIENIYLEDREFNDPAALKHHEDEICEKCYVSTNCVYEKRMSYVDYKIEYISCRKIVVYQLSNHVIVFLAQFTG